MLQAAEPTVCRIRHKCAYIPNGQFVNLNLHSIVAAIPFSAHEVLFGGPFLLGKIAQHEAMILHISDMRDRFVFVP